MKHLNIFIATLVLTCAAMFPAASLAKGLDDLDVTMEVLDSTSDIDDAVAQMRGPGDDDDHGTDDGGGNADVDEDEVDGSDDFSDEDGFENDDDFDDEDGLEDEDGIDEGEDIDDDAV